MKAVGPPDAGACVVCWCVATAVNEEYCASAWAGQCAAVTMGQPTSQLACMAVKGAGAQDERCVYTGASPGPESCIAKSATTCATSAQSAPTSASAAVVQCMDVCDSLGEQGCCGFRYDQARSPLDCELVRGCASAGVITAGAAHTCQHGCVGHFYRRQLLSRAPRQDPRDVTDLDTRNSYVGSPAAFALVRGLAYGLTYDFWIAPIANIGSAQLASLPVDGCRSVVPSFQQMTVPGRPAAVATTSLWNDALRVQWTPPLVPADVTIEGYQVYLTSAGETLGARSCVDDPHRLVETHSGGGILGACQALTAPVSFGGPKRCDTRLPTGGVVLFDQCCTSCAGFGYYPDSADFSSLDLSPTCGHCGVFVPASPTSFVARGLSRGATYDFYMVPILSDGPALRQKHGLPYTGKQNASALFSQWTAPGVVASAQATTLSFTSVRLTWTPPGFAAGVQVAGYKVLYRRSFCGRYHDSVALTRQNDLRAAMALTSATIYGLARATAYDFVIVPIIVDATTLTTVRKTPAPLN